MLVPVTLAVIGLAALVIASGMGNPVNQPIGPGLVPMVLSVVIVAGSLVDLALIWRRPASAGHSEAETSGGEHPGADRNSERPWVLCGLALVVGVFAWRLAGYLPGLAVCVAAVVFADGEMKPIPGVVFSVVLVAALWFLFDMVLGVSLG